MSTRKILRNSMRRTAELKGYRSSAYVRSTWNYFQQKTVGSAARLIHQAIGSKKRRTHRERILSALGDKKQGTIV